jgi:hypothetical protein
LGEHQLDKLGVTGSSPVPPISRKRCSSLHALPRRRDLRDEQRREGIGHHHPPGDRVRWRHGLGIPARRIAVGHKPPKKAAITSYELVRRVDQRRRADGSQETCESAGYAYLGEERHSSPAVAWNRCPVAKH